MPGRDDDVLNVLNTNTQNNSYSQGQNQDDALGVLNTNTQDLQPQQQPTNSFGVSLTEDESNARTQGYVEARANVQHFNQDEINFSKKQARVLNTGDDGQGGQVIKRSAAELGLGEGHVNDDGTVNYTASSYASLDEQSINTTELYQDVLGRSKFSELKRVCGLADNESYTDFYNRTHYIPKGYEIESRLALAEEKRMKLYVRYRNGEISESDFLYQAYGKDLLKEQGYDLDSKLFWYNRYKNGDYTNPLDSDTFLGDLIANAKTIFENEQWAKDTSEKTFATSLAGLVATGQKLSTDKVYDIFKTQIDALSESFNNDVSKVITYYQAGTLGGVFNPFIDIDGDNKYDYYYHLDGKMYAVSGSSGVGKSTVDIEYNDDGTVHSVEVNDGLEGWFGGLLEGFRDFWVGFVDIFAMVGSVFAGIGDAANGGTYWVDSQQRWEAWKKEWLSQEDRVTFDSQKRPDDWGYEISKGIGTVAGMVVLTVATWGIGTAVSGAGQAASAGASAGANAASQGTVAGVQSSLQAALQNYGQQFVKETGKQMSQRMVNEFTRSFLKAATKQAGSAVTSTIAAEVARTMGTSTAKLAASHIATNTLKAVSYVGKAVSGARNGTFGGTTEFAKRTVPILVSALRDTASTWGQLEAQNQVLDYLSKQEGSDVKALTQGEIAARAIGLGVADFVIGSALRLQGDYGLTNSRIGAVNFYGWLGNSDTAVRGILDSSAQITKDQMRNLVNIMARSAVIDNIADVAENMLTAGVQAALANPYAEIGSGESWVSFARGMVNPQVLVSSLYQTIQNVKSMGSWSQSTIDSRMSNLIQEYQGNTGELVESIQRTINKIASDKTIDAATAKANAQALQRVSQQVKTILSNDKGSYLDNVLEASKLLDQLYSRDVSDETIATSFNLNKEEVTNLRNTVEYLNKTKRDEEPEYGFASAMIFDKANKRTAEQAIQSLNNLYLLAKDEEVRKMNAWKWFASPYIFKSKVNFDTGNNMYSMLRNLVQKVNEQQNKTIALADVPWQNYFIAERAFLAGDIQSITNEKVNKLLNPDNKESPVEFHYNTASSIMANSVMFKQGKNGNYEVVKTGKDNVADLPFVKLILSAYNGDEDAKKQYNELVASHLINITKNERGEITAMFLDENHPMAGIEFKREMRNRILSEPFLRDAQFAFDFLDFLSSNKDINGQPLFNFDVPLVKKIRIKEGTSDNPDSYREIYFFPLGENETSYQQIVNRFHTVVMLASDYLRVLSGEANSLDKTALENTFIRMHLLSDQETSINDLFLKLDNLQDMLDDTEQREQLLQDAIPHVTSLILSRAKFFVAPDGQAVTNGEEVTRAQLLTLYNKRVITKETLEQIVTGSQKVGVTPNAITVAKEFLSYVDTLDKINKVMDMLGTTFLEGTDVSTSRLKLEQQDLLADLVRTLNDPNNKGLTDTLSLDKRIGKIIEEIRNNPQAYSNFFRGFGRDGRVQTQENISAILNARSRESEDGKKFESFLNNLLDDKVYNISTRSIEFEQSARKYLYETFKNVNGYNRRSQITSNKFESFLEDPAKFIDELPESAFYFNGNKAAENIAIAKQQMKDALPHNEDGTINLDQFGLDAIATQLPNVKTQKDLFDFLTQPSTDENIIIDYLRLESGNLLGSIDLNDIDYDPEKNIVLYKGEGLTQKLIKSKRIEGKLADDARESSINRIFQALDQHTKLIYKGTQLEQAQNVLEINLIELQPNELSRLFGLFRQQQEALVKRDLKAKVDEKELKRAMVNLLTGTGSGVLSYQERQYRKLIKQALFRGDLIMSFDMNDSAQMELATNLLTRLGYDDDLFRLKNHETVIPGVVYKNINTHNIKTDINSETFFNAIKSYISVTPIHSKGYIPSSYRYLLRDMFSNIVRMDDNTTIKLFNNNEALKLYGVQRDSSSIKLGDGLTHKPTTQKHGLLGGELSQVFSFLMDSVMFDGNVDEATRTTFNAIKVIDRLCKYADSEYSAKALSLPTSGSQELSDTIDNFYKQDNSLYLYVLDTDISTKDRKVFKLNKNFDLEKFAKFISTNNFDIKYLIPVWSGDTSNKTYDFQFDKDVSFETPFSVIHQIDGYGTIEEILEKSITPLQILNIDTDVYKSIFDYTTDKKGKRTYKESYTVGELKNKLSNLTNEQANNYFVKMLSYYINVGEESFKQLSSSVRGAELIKFAHPIAIEIAGDMLAYDKYKPLLNQAGSFDQSLLDEFVNELNTKIKSPEWQWNYEYNNDVDYFDDDVSSSDIIKLNPTNTLEDFTSDDVNALLSVLRRTSDFLMTKLDSTADLIDHNVLLSCIQTFVDIDKDGNITIPIEYYKQTSFDDRRIFKETLTQMTNDPTLDSALKANIAKIIKALDEKDTLITALGGDYEIRSEFSDLDTQEAYENLSSKNPSITINPSLYFSTGAIPNAHKERIVELLTNKLLTKVPANKLITSSSIDYNKSDIDPLMKWFTGLINKTTYRTTDKEGSIIVYNLDVNEALGEFFDTIVSFNQAVKSINEENNILKGIRPEDVDNVLYELGLKANIYSSGVTYDSEYAGALILKYNTETGDYEITPLVTSSSDKDRDIMFNLYSESYRSDAYDKYIMLTTSKNSFKYSISGFDGKTNLYDLDDAETMRNIFQASYKRAYENSSQIEDLIAGNITPEELVFNYYKPHLTYSGLYENLANTAKKFGMADATIQSLYPMIETMNVRNSANMTETQVNTYVSQFVSRAAQYLDESVSFTAFKEAVINGINKFALSDNAKLQLDNYQNNFLKQKDTDVAVRDMTERILQREDISTLSKDVSKFTKEQKIALVKNLLTRRQAGRDLAAIFNTIDGSSLKEFFSNIIVDDNIEAFNFLDKKFGMFDSEWLYSSDEKQRAMYQFAITIHNPIKDSNGYDIEKNGNNVVILIRDAFKDANLNTLKHSEENESFNTKLDYIRGTKPLPKGYVIVDSFNDAVAYLESLTKDVEIMVGYNNRATKSDNSFFENIGDSHFKELIMSSVDAREDILQKTYAALVGKSGKELPLEARESTDAFREVGFITERAGRTAHDALSDVLDQVDLVLKLRDTKVNTGNLYKQLEIELKGLLGDDYDEVVKDVNFKDMNFNTKYDNDLIESIKATNNQFKHGNTVVKQMLDSYNVILETQNRAIENKKFDRMLSSVISSFDTADSEAYMKALENKTTRRNVQNIFISLFKEANSNVLDFQNEKAYRYVLDQFYYAMKKYGDDYKKNNPQYHYLDISNERLFERFLSLPQEKMLEYLYKSTPSLKKFIEENPVTEKDWLDFNQQNKSTLFSHTSTTDYLKQATELTEEGASYAYRLEKSIINPVLNSLKVFGGSNSAFAQSILSDLLKVYGLTDEARKNIKTWRDYVKDNNMSSRMSDETFNTIKSLLTEDLYNEIAAYQMFHEKATYSATAPNGEEGENGTIYIGRKKWKQLYPDADYGDEFYTRVWRQPGQQKTVMHVMKVKLVDGDTFSMTRDTAKSYFNGDFDGDFYYIGKPNNDDQTWGNALWKFNNVSANFINTVFKGRTWNDTTQYDSKMYDAIFQLGQEIFSTDNSILTAYKNAINSLDQNDIDEVNNMLKKAAKAFIKKTMKVSKSDDVERYAEIFADTLGLKRHVPTGMKAAYVTSGNFFIKDNPNLQEEFNKLDEGNRQSKQNNVLQTDIDSSIIGQIAKQLSGEYYQGKASDILFNSTFTMTDESINYLNALLKAGYSKKKLSSIKDAIKDALNDYKETVSITDANGNKVADTQFNANIDLLIKAVDNYTKSDINAENILYISQVLQALVQNTKAYNNTIASTLKTTNETQTNQFREKVSLISDYIAKSQESVPFIEQEAINKASGPQLAIYASEMLGNLVDMNMVRDNRFSNKDNAGLANLFNSVLIKSNLFENTRNGLHVISNSDLVKTTDNSIGLGDVIIGVRMDDRETDSGYVVDVKRYDKKQKDHYISNIRSIPLNNISENSLSKLRSILNASTTTTFTGKQLNEILHPAEKFANNRQYIIDGIINGLDEQTNVITKNSHIVIRSKMSLYEGAEQQVLKGGMVNTKMLKASLGTAQDLKTFEKGFVPSMLFGKNLFDISKASIYNTIEDLGKNVVTADGGTYKLYRVKDYTLLNVSDIEASNVNERSQDWVSIIQGSHGADAAFNMGSLYYSVNDDGTITFDPSGVKQLNEAKIRSGIPTYQDVNGANIVMLSRIAIELNQIKDKDKLQKILDKVSPSDIGFKNVKQLLMTLYRYGDLGGEFGASIERYIRHQLSDSELLSLRNTIANKDEALARVMFSQEIEDMLDSRVLTSAEDIGEPTARKKNNTATNQRATKARWVSSADNVVANIEGSQYDTNGLRFVPRSTILRMLMEELGQNYNRGFMMDCIRNHLIDAEDIINGNRLNNYNSIIRGQGIGIDTSKLKQTNVNMKSGSLINEGISLKVNENEALADIIRNSRFEKGMNNYNNNVYNKIKENVLGGRDYITQKYIAPFLLNGTMEDVFNARNNFRTSTRITDTRAVATLNSDATDIGLNTSWNIIDSPDIYDARKKLDEAIKSPKYMTIKNKLETLTPEDLNKNGISYREFIGMLDDKANYILKTDAQQFDELSRIMKANEDIFEQEKGNLAIEEVDLSDLMKDVNEEEITAEMIKISCGDNQTEFQNSYLSGSGLKAKDGLAIGIGTEILRQNQIIETLMKKYLGSEFATLQYITSKNKAIFAKFNAFMNMEKNIQIYDELTLKAKEHKNRLGSKRYEEYVNAVVAKITGNGSTTIDEVKKLQNELYNKNDMLTVMVKYARQINARLLEQAKKLDPYAICGWFIPTSETPSSMRKYGEDKYINAYNAYHENISKVINGDITGDKQLKFATLLNDNELGYVGSVLKASKQLAETEALTYLTDYAKRKGFMRNVEIYSHVNEFINKNVVEFINSFNTLSKEKFEDSEAINEETFNRLRYLATEIGISNGDIGKYQGPESFVEFLNFVKEKELFARQEIGYENDSQLENLIRNSQDSNNANLVKAAKINNLYQSTLSVMMNILCENTGKTMNEFLIKLYNSVLQNSKVDLNVYTLVDDRGAKLTGASTYVPMYEFENPIDGMLRHIKYGIDEGTDEQKVAIARMMLQGDVYFMRKSLADQLEEKVFTKQLPTYLNEILRTAKNISTTAIMSAPTMAMNAWFNFPIFDTGAVLNSDFAAAKYLKPAINALNKLAFTYENLTEEQIKADPYLQYAIRYIFSTNQDLIKGKSVRGESTSAGLNIPLLKEYLKMSNFMYNIGNSIPRFAYWLDLVKSAEANNYQIDPKKTGVAFHLMKGIREVEGNTDITDIYNSLIKTKSNPNFNSDLPEGPDNPREIIDLYSKQLTANVDAQAAAIVAEHNGLENNMPYLSRKLSQKFNTMFLAFPLQLVRWGKNRLQSLGYAFTHLNVDNDARGYLARQLGSVLATQTLLLALQIAMSKDTQEYLGLWGQEKKEEQSEEEKENATNILWRGGCIKLFDAMIKGEETTTPHHSRGPAFSLFDSYIADFIPEFNKDYNEDGFFKTLWNKFKEKTLGHTNFIIKDVIESIPGNKEIQSTSWVEPGDNFWENYGRKILAYTMGYTQANNFVDYMKSTNDTSADESLFNRLRDGMAYAYTKNYANTKENKSEYRNYKKAFTVLYNYKELYKGPRAEGYQLTSDSSSYNDIKDDFQLAIKTQSSPSAVYAIVEKYVEKGISLGTIRSALRTCSLRYQINNIQDKQHFLSNLTTADKATIKSALAYEDNNYAFLENILDDLDYQYKQAEAENRSSYTNYNNAISTILRNRYYNVPKRYYRGAKYHNPNYLNFVNNYINNVNYKNRYRNQQSSSPLNVFNQMQQAQSYGTSRDVWGNETRHYTDGTTYNVRQPGMPFPGGNK